MPEIVNFNLIFAASIDSTTIANSAPVKGGTMVDTGIGVTTITLSDGGIYATESIAFVTPREAGEAHGGLTHTNDTVKVVTMRVGATVTDIDADVLILRIL